MGRPPQGHRRVRAVCVLSSPHGLSPSVPLGRLATPAPPAHSGEAVASLSQRTAERNHHMKTAVCAVMRGPESPRDRGGCAAGSDVTGWQQVGGRGGRQVGLAQGLPRSAAECMRGQGGRWGGEANVRATPGWSEEGVVVLPEAVPGPTA